MISREIVKVSLKTIGESFFQLFSNMITKRTEFTSNENFQVDKIYWRYESKMNTSNES